MSQTPLRQWAPQVDRSLFGILGLASQDILQKRIKTIGFRQTCVVSLTKVSLCHQRGKGSKKYARNAGNGQTVTASHIFFFFFPPPRNSFSMKSPFARAVSYGGKGKYFNNNTENVNPIYGQQKPENSSVSAKISQHPWKMLWILQLGKLQPFKHIPLSISKRSYSTCVFMNNKC